MMQVQPQLVGLEAEDRLRRLRSGNQHDRQRQQTHLMR
jgi:hypothetical protein